MSFDKVSADEMLYRCIRAEYAKLVDGVCQCSENAFLDPEKEPSVDRANYCNNNPEYSRRDATDGIASLSAQEIRNIQNVVMRSENGKTIKHKYTIDIKPDPLEGNLAHAKIYADELLTSKPFKKLKEELAKIANIILNPS